MMLKKETKKERKKELPFEYPVKNPPTHFCLSGDDASSAPSLHGVLSAAAAPSQHKNNKLQSYRLQLTELKATPHNLEPYRWYNGPICPRLSLQSSGQT